MDFITPSQCRAARGLLNWSQPELAEKCGIHTQTISAFENETSTPTKTTLEKIKVSFEDNGVECSKDGGVAPRNMRFKHLQGTDGFKELINDVYYYASTTGGVMKLWNAKPDNWIKWLGKDFMRMQSDRMEKIIHMIDYRITAEENDSNFISGKYAEYRWIPKKAFNDQSIYAYGNRIAFVNFEENDINIYILYSWRFADSFRLLFDFVWDEITTIPDVKGYKP